MLKTLIAEPDNFSVEVLNGLNEIGTVDQGPIDVSELPKAFEQYDVFWFRLGFKINAQTVGNGPIKTRFIACPVTGLDHIDEKWAAEKGIKIISLRGEKAFLRSVRATSEWTMALMQMIMRRGCTALNHTKGGGWNRDLFRGQELYEKTLGVIGIGRLGSIVCEYAKAFGMNVVGFDTQTFDGRLAKPMKSLTALARTSDVISIHVPYNQSTHHLLGKEFFEAIKPNSFLVNTSRGGIVKETAMIEALKSGKLAGAALDVIEGEPSIQQSPLFEYAQKNENLIISPHIGGNTYESFEKTESFILKKLISQINQI